MFELWSILLRLFDFTSVRDSELPCFWPIPNPEICNSLSFLTYLTYLFVNDAFECFNMAIVAWNNNFLTQRRYCLSCSTLFLAHALPLEPLWFAGFHDTPHSKDKSTACITLYGIKINLDIKNSPFSTRKFL